MNSKTFGLGLALAVVMVAFGLFMFRPSAEANQASAPTASTGYSVVDSDGTNLLVVDNTTSTLYFYTVDPGKEVGDDLHLRGSLDLKEVGKPVLKAKKAAN
jgi:hypothetical protein